MNPVVEGIAVALGLAYLLLAIAERRSCWLAGGAASLLFLAVFWRAGLPMQALLQVYYVAIAAHGWSYWGRSDSAAAAPVRRSRRLDHVAALGLCLALAAATQALRGGFADGSGWLDSLTSFGGVVATWMVARKHLEAWLYWIVIDLATAVLYLDTGLLASAGLYVLYSALAWLGWRQWRKHYRRQLSQPANAFA